MLDINNMKIEMWMTYDGEVLIPDEPINLAPGTRVTLTILEVIGDTEAPVVQSED